MNNQFHSLHVKSYQQHLILKKTKKTMYEDQSTCNTTLININN